MQNKSMRPSVRQAAIFEMIEKRGRATVEQLAEKFGASAETVRRDLSALAEAGRVRKVYGGAVKVNIAKEGLFEERLATNTRAKREIAEKLSQLVRPGQSIMIDTGSTTLICIEAIMRHRDLTVITNSTHIAEVVAAAKNGSSALLLGGIYSDNNAQTVGAQTCAEIRRIRTDHVVLTISALDSSGAYDFSEDEAQVARAMIEGADALTLVADGSKLGRVSTFRICELPEIRNVILDVAPPSDLGAALIAADVNII
ncbi:DeoR/GlpR family DNA-binding transcription regulator [Hoeflea sp.]|uniref:DeoR/GlpR family DNA-binding transcription regulator n=1 Tax=Hoeflea sp. TaxID=1940281 RepID=UPI002AFF73A3|nr:DeoR/GlpR family DNA-binding transcription regulator [Hoeflea sp.]